ncbi:MAG: hypothetical protein V7727_19785 [Sneathiella sp.]
MSSLFTEPSFSTLKILQVEWQDQGLIEHPSAIHIGINTGYCTTGNIGNEEQGAIAVKGLRKPIRTYRVTGILDEDAVIPFTIEGFSLDLDMEEMSNTDKQPALQKLRKEIAEMEGLPSQ